MNKSKEYVINTIILFIGKFSTQFMSFLLLPIYTHYLSTNDYGFVDILQTYMMLFVPVLMLRFDSAAFRFLVDERNNETGKKTVITNICVSLLFQVLLFIIIFLVLKIFMSFDYFYLVLFNIPILMISNVLLQLVRGLGENKVYSIACIIIGFITLVINIIMIIAFNGNAGSILVASCVANFIGIIYLSFKINLVKYIDYHRLSKIKLIELLKYSLPMLPNSLSWWIVNVSDRSIITYFIGVSANGIYSVSSKFSNIINSLFGIFNMSWQESVALHIDDDDRDEFLSDMINRILLLFLHGSIVIVAILPLVYNILIGSQYMSAYNYIPILLLANVFSIFINLIGGIYIAKKETKKMAMTTIVSAALNIVINLLFVKKYGLYSAAISTLVAYLATLIYRYFDLKKYINFHLYKKSFFLSLLLFVSVSICYYINNWILLIFVVISTLLIMIYYYKDIIFIIFKQLKRIGKGVRKL